MHVWLRNVRLAIVHHCGRHVRHALVLLADLPAQDVHAALRVSRAAGAGAAALSRLPSLRPDDLHRLRQVRQGLPGRLHLHRQGKEPASARASTSPASRSTTRSACSVRCASIRARSIASSWARHYDQSCFSRDGCIVDFAKLPLEMAWGQATLNPTAVAAIEDECRCRSGRSRPTRRSRPQPRRHRAAQLRATSMRRACMTELVALSARCSSAVGVGVLAVEPDRSASCSARPSRTPEKGDDLRMRRADHRQRVGSVRPALLRRRAAVRDLRRGNGVLLPVGGRVRQGESSWPTNTAVEQRMAVEPIAAGTPAKPTGTAAIDAAATNRWPGSRSSTSWSSSACCWSASPTCGSAATSTGSAARPAAERSQRPQRRRSVTWVWLEGRFEEGVRHHDARTGDQLGPRIEHVADDVRPGLLRHRDDGHRRVAATTSTASAPAPSAPRRGRPT